TNQPTVAVVAPGGEALASPLDSSPSSTVVAADAGPVPRAAAAAAPNTSTTADAADFLVGTPTTPDTRGSITIAVPAPAAEATQTGTASFKRWAKVSTWASDPCAAW